jgi:hypothetical protein
MKLSRSLFPATLVVAMIFVLCCRKSDHTEPDNNNNNPKPIEYVTASISGRVTDEANLPVSGAIVKAGTGTASTDINGSFRITNISLDKNAGFVKVEKDGFFQGSRTIVVNGGVVNYVSVQLIKKVISGTVSGNSGGNVTVSTGGSINFTGNSFVNTGNGTAYTGTVSVSAFFINPAATNFSEIMPGTLRGITTANQETGLQSYGMMAVELSGAAGEKLQLASGKTATITFPIPAALQEKAPATIPLWSLNDTTGLWKEEGTATKQGNNYIGTVSHFSFWNCDHPYPVVDFKAVIKDKNGNALYPAKVVLKTIGDSSISADGYTDTTGSVSGKIPTGKTLQLSVYNSCNTVVHTQNIGPFSTAADLGTVTVNNTGPVQLIVTGTVINCSAASVTNGFVDINIDNNHHRALVTNGNFSSTISRCSNSPVTAIITAYDISKNQVGPATNLSVTSGTINAGQLSACGNDISEYVNYIINGVNYNFVRPADSMNILKVDPQFYGENVYNIWCNANDYPVNNGIGSLYFHAPSTGTFPIIYIQVHEGTSNRYGSKAKDSTKINITEFGPPGGYIGGNLSGNVYLLADTTKPPSKVNVIFRLKRP